MRLCEFGESCATRPETPSVCLSECPILENERTHTHTRTPTPTHKGRDDAGLESREQIGGRGCHARNLCFPCRSSLLTSCSQAIPAAHTHTHTHTEQAQWHGHTHAGLSSELIRPIAWPCDKPRGSTVAAQAIVPEWPHSRHLAGGKKHSGQGGLAWRACGVAERPGVTSLCRDVSDDYICYDCIIVTFYLKFIGDGYLDPDAAD